MSEHLKSPASTSESEQTKQQEKMNAIRSSLQKLEEEEEFKAVLIFLLRF